MLRTSRKHFRPRVNRRSLHRLHKRSQPHRYRIQLSGSARSGQAPSSHLYISTNDVKAQAVAAKAYAKAQRPFYKKKRYWLVAVLAIIVIASVANGSKKNTNTSSALNGGAKTLSNNGTHPPQADVTVTRCAADSSGEQASLQVLNHSSGRSNYEIEVAFDTADGKTQIDTATVFVNNLEAGQSANETASAFGSANGAFTCKVTDVNRYASS